MEEWTTTATVVADEESAPEVLGLTTATGHEEGEGTVDTVVLDHRVGTGGERFRRCLGDLGWNDFVVFGVRSLAAFTFEGL